MILQRTIFALLRQKGFVDVDTWNKNGWFSDHHQLQLVAVLRNDPTGVVLAMRMRWCWLAT